MFVGNAQSKIESTNKEESLNELPPQNEYESDADENNLSLPPDVLNFANALNENNLEDEKDEDSEAVGTTTEKKEQGEDISVSGDEEIETFSEGKENLCIGDDENEEYEMQKLQEEEEKEEERRTEDLRNIATFRYMDQTTERYTNNRENNSCNTQAMYEGAGTHSTDLLVSSNKSSFFPDDLKLSDLISL